MIKQLTPDEAARLRKLVRDRFLQSPFNGSGFRVTQYKKSYQPLADNIHRSVAGVEASVTTYRLRKFFYYTDPDVCDESKLEKPSFGDDFIEALLKYIEEVPVGIPPKSTFRYRKRLWQVSTLLLCSVITVAGWRWMTEPPKYWEESFDDVSIKGLKSRGFKFLDYDSAAFSRQMKPGQLTLFTYPGDYWVKWDSGEVPVIKNMLVKRLECNHCVLSTEITKNFNPSQNWQQAGVFLFGPEIDPKNNVRITFCYDEGRGYESLLHGIYAKKVQKIMVVLLRNGLPEEKTQVVRLPEVEIDLQELYLFVNIDRRKIMISFRYGNTWNALHQDSNIEMELPFVPAYVGLGAFQGFTDERGKPLGADTIPVFFDYLKVEPLRE